MFFLDKTVKLIIGLNHSKKKKKKGLQPCEENTAVRFVQLFIVKMLSVR